MEEKRIVFKKITHNVPQISIKIYILHPSLTKCHNGDLAYTCYVLDSNEERSCIRPPCHYSNNPLTCD